MSARSHGGPGPSLRLEETGRRSARLLMPGGDWVHRRVQRISYLDSGLQRMQLSVDFTVPDGELGTHLPISVLPKWPPLYRLDFRRPDGRPVPLLTSEQNGFADRALLFEFAAAAGVASLHEPNFRAAVSSLACGPETDLFEPFVAFLDGLGDRLDDLRVARLAEIGATLTSTTLLWYPIGDLASGDRTVCKLEYLMRAEESLHWYERLGRALSWYQPEDYINLWHAGADANFHADIEVPKPLIIRAAEPSYLSFADPAGAASDFDTDQPDRPGVRPGQFVDVAGRQAHVYITGQRPLAIDLNVRFAPTRGGMMVSALLASIMIATLVTLMFVWRTWVSAADNIDGTVALLVLAPALIGYLVVRPADHPVARRHIVGIQALSVAAAVIPLAMGVLLLRYEHDPGSLASAWRWPVIVSWAIVIVILIGLRGAGSGRIFPVKEAEHDH